MKQATFESAADAVLAHNDAKLERLLAKHPGLALATSSALEDETLLHEAASEGQLRMCEMLLAAGADVNRVSRRRGKVPLTEGAHDALVVGLLLGAGAHPDGAAITTTSPLMIAGHSGSLASSRLLLDAGAELNREAILSPMTALDFAIRWSSPVDLTTPGVGGIAPGPAQQRVAEYLAERGGVRPYVDQTWEKSTPGFKHIEHIAKNVGPVNPLAEDRAQPGGETITIRKARFAPKKYLHQMLFTVGLAEAHRVEIAVCLPRLWPLNRQSLALLQYAWPYEMLACVASAVRSGLSVKPGSLLDHTTPGLTSLPWPTEVVQWACATLPALEAARGKGVPTTVVLVPVTTKKPLKAGKEAMAFVDKKTKPAPKNGTRWAQLEVPYESPYIGWVD